MGRIDAWQSIWMEGVKKTGMADQYQCQKKMQEQRGIAGVKWREQGSSTSKDAGSPALKCDDTRRPKQSVDRKTRRTDREATQLDVGVERMLVLMLVAAVSSTRRR